MRAFIVFTLVLAVSVATVSSQASCCAPQPVVIQLSCNGQGSSHGQGRPPMPPPPPPPHHHHPEPTTTAAPERINLEWDMDRQACIYNMGHDGLALPEVNEVLSAGFPDGFAIYQGNDGKPYATIPNDSEAYPSPPSNWDGWYDTLPFPMPPKGTPHYNMLLCYPYDNAAGFVSAVAG